MGKIFYSDRTYELVRKRKGFSKTVIDVRGVQIGGNMLTVMAGPCTVENKSQILRTARFIKKSNGHILRGGVFKPCTYPYRFRGLGEEGLRLLEEARDKTGLPVITEVMDAADIEMVYKYADILQVGTRNMQNYTLLTELGRQDKPVFLKRGIWATVDEFLGAAEYIMKEGNRKVILCERGGVSFEDHTRWTLSLSIVPALKAITHLPVIVDPSHGTGKRNLVLPMARAAVAVGADGLMIEVHPSPDKSVSDAVQTMNFREFGRVMKEIEPVANAVGRSVFSSRARDFSGKKL